MHLEHDTIVAIATPPGRGGIAVLRLSGPHARTITAPLLHLRHPLAHAQARFTHILDEHGEVLDEAVVTFFAAPHSYTSEDVVEISAHGAPVLLDFLLRAAIARGARLAAPGEFTQRAFLSGRLDLTQAEAVHDLISANTLQQAKTAAAQLGGSISRALAPLKHALLDLIAQLEAGVDFAEDDLDLLPESEIQARITMLHTELESLLSTYSYGRILREGARLALVGRPNAGKSSLFNRLLERDRAIVTAQPGTTRDSIAESFDLAGFPITLIDTAGLRDVSSASEHEAERQGIVRARAAMAEADLVLHIVDASTLSPAAPALSPDDEATRQTLAGRPTLLILNKADLNPVALPGFEAICISALTGQGMLSLRQAILSTLAKQPVADTTLITSLRHAEALRESVAALGEALAAVKNSLPHEFLLLDLHTALESLDHLTGATTPDEILARIFSTFCIGK